MRARASLGAIAFVLAACGGAGAPPPEVAPADPAGAATARSVEGVPRCEDVPENPLPREHLRDQPIYVANEQPVDELLAWARQQTGFEELWIERDHLGWVVLAFSQDAEARQAELTERFPGVGAVVLAVDWRLRDLRRTQNSVGDTLRLDSWGASVNVQKGVVEVDIGPMTEDRLAAVEPFAGEPVCVTGRDPADLPSEGPQPQAGEGWRLLADEATGDSYRTWLAADEEAYQQLWRDIGLAGTPPPVDFATEVVIWFGAVYSGSCPTIRLDDVVVDHERALVHGRITRVDEARSVACTSDANPRAYVVALERASLPAAPFAIQLDADDPPGGAPEERTVVRADLRVPGSAPTGDEIGPDPSLSEPQPHVEGPGGVVEPGWPSHYRLDVRCGVEWLGPLNDVMWRADVTDVPAAWREELDGESLVVEVLIETEPARLTATANGHEVSYAPTSASPPACD